MKKIILSMFFLLAAQHYISAQMPVLKTYAYSRVTLPGVRPERDAAGNENIVAPNTYFIYLKVSKGKKIEPKGLWIKGKFYTVKTHKITSPVVIEKDVADGDKLTLVAKTTEDVYTLDQGGEKEHEPCAETEKLKGANELVVVYNYNGKKQYAVVKKIIVLAAVPGM